MRKIKLDGRKMDSRQAAFAYIKTSLALPDWFGNNLDALADCLGEMADVEITFSHAGAAINALGDYGQALIAVFQDQAAGRQDFRFRLLKASR